MRGSVGSEVKWSQGCPNRQQIERERERERASNYRRKLEAMTSHTEKVIREERPEEV